MAPGMRHRLRATVHHDAHPERSSSGEGQPRERDASVESPARSPAHLVDRIRRDPLFHLLAQLIDQAALKPSQLASLRVSRAALNELWDALLPLPVPAPHPSVLPGAAEVPLRGRPCWYGLNCRSGTCPFWHPSPANRCCSPNAPTNQDLPHRDLLQCSAAVEDASNTSNNSCGRASPADMTVPSLAAMEAAPEIPVASATPVEAIPENAEYCDHRSRRPAQHADNDDDVDLAQAIAMSLQVTSSWSGTPPVPHAVYADGHRQRATRRSSCDSPGNLQSWHGHRIPQHRATPTGGAAELTDAIQRPRSPHSALPIAPLCGDCNPPASWQIRFASGRCSSCRARVDVTFQPNRE